MRRQEALERLLSLAGLILSIELILFKFLPDLSTALLQGSESVLTDFAAYRAAYFSPGSVHYSRFLGNYTLYELAAAIGHLYHSADIRLHPLRVAAGLLTPVYVLIGVLPVLKDGDSYSWPAFMVPYSLAALMSLYAFYPCDLASLAFLSLSLYCMLRERLGWSLLFLLVTGLFRESSFHGVFFVALRAFLRPGRAACSWVAIFTAAFAGEYLLVRHFFPGPLSASGGVILDPRYILFGPGMFSLTTICSLSLAVLFPLAYLLKASESHDADWRRRFFLLNSYALPLWIVFYRMLSGNISEFRMLLPALLPCMYGLAYESRPRSRPLTDRAPAAPG